MASLQEIKARLNSVKTTKKITKAMELVATAKIQKAKKELNSIQEYYTSVYDMFQDLLSNVEDASKLMPSNPENAILYILISSDIGLCGGYNGNMVKMLKSIYTPSDAIIVAGNKGISAAKANNWNTLLKFPHVGDQINYQIAADISREALAKFTTGKVKAVKLIYTKFINTVTFEATMQQLLPIDTTKHSEQASTISTVTEFEPSAEVVLQSAMPLYVSALVYGAMVESKVSEMSSRRMAMENATDNADDLIGALDLEYNRNRQAKITQEISEIVGGATAD